jgi:predicted metal-dependent hydrolase
MVSPFTLGDIEVDVGLKDIKNVHLSVHPPTGRVRISAPKPVSIDTLRVFAISKLDWIKQEWCRKQIKHWVPPVLARRHLVEPSHSRRCTAGSCRSY